MYTHPAPMFVPLVESGPSFDGALEGAIEDASKDVVESIKKVTATAKK